jgi:hypothetical protein
MAAIVRKERDLISRKYQARRRNTKAFAKERERRRMISCRIRLHYAELPQIEVRKRMRPDILSGGFSYQRDEIGREVKHAVGIEIGIAWIDGELRVDVARRCRRAEEVVLPILARQCSHCRPSRTHSASREQPQEL